MNKLFLWGVAVPVYCVVSFLIFFWFLFSFPPFLFTSFTGRTESPFHTLVISCQGMFSFLVAMFSLLWCASVSVFFFAPSFCMYVTQFYFSFDPLRLHATALQACMIYISSPSVPVACFGRRRESSLLVVDFFAGSFFSIYFFRA